MYIHPRSCMSLARKSDGTCSALRARCYRRRSRPQTRYPPASRLRGCSSFNIQHSIETDPSRAGCDIQEYTLVILSACAVRLVQEIHGGGGRGRVVCRWVGVWYNPMVQQHFGAAETRGVVSWSMMHHLPIPPSWTRNLQAFSFRARNQGAHQRARPRSRTSSSTRSRSVRDRHTPLSITSQ